jgi:glycosyltransferase involved in cell wall biosynthesis
MNWGNALIAVSAFVRQHMLSNFGTRPDRITTVYNGVSPDLYEPERSRAMSEKYRRELGIGPDTPVVGMVASLTPRKGYTYFIGAAENIIRKYPDVVFLGVGGGVQQDELEALVRDRRLDGRFRFLGVRQDVRDLICAFDIFVLSSMSEGLPYVILEAMCMKKPVVSSSVGGIPEAVEHGKNGLLVPPRDTEALTQSILTLLENPEMAHDMGDASHHLIAETFNVRRMVDSTEQIYMKVFD